MLKETIDKFWQVELQNDFLDLEIGGVKFWPLIRFQVFAKIRESALNEKPANTGVGDLKFIDSISMLKSAIKNYFYNDFRKIKPKDFLFYGHPRRKFLNDGYWWDIYIDPLIEEFHTLDYNFVERSFNGKHFKPSKTKNILHFDLFEYYARFISKRKKYNFSNSDIQVIDLIESKLSSHFDVSVNIRTLLSRQLLLRDIYLPYFLDKLKKSNPKVLFVTVSYSSQIIIEAAKVLNIPVVELQHGLISSMHIGYSYPKKISSKFYPDYLFVFGEFWKKHTQLPIDDNNVLVSGYPFFTNNLDRINKFKSEKEVIEKQILFISQGTVGTELSKLAVDLKIAQPHLQVVYKLHGGEYNSWKNSYPNLLNSNVKVIDSDDIDFYSLMCQSSAIVSVYSTAIYEALGIGKKVYLLNLPSIQYVSELIDNQYVKVINDHLELLDNIDVDSEVSNGWSDPNYFFNSDWRKAFASCIETVLAK